MVKLSDEAIKLIKKYQKTEKQKEFQFDFFVDQSKYEKWEDLKEKGFLILRDLFEGHNQKNRQTNRP